jgi:hypothetical protein
VHQLNTPRSAPIGAAHFPSLLPINIYRRSKNDDQPKHRIAVRGRKPFQIFPFSATSPARRDERQFAAQARRAHPASVQLSDIPGPASAGSDRGLPHLAPHVRDVSRITKPNDCDLPENPGAHLSSQRFCNPAIGSRWLRGCFSQSQNTGPVWPTLACASSRTSGPCVANYTRRSSPSRPTTSTFTHAPAALTHVRKHNGDSRNLHLVSWAFDSQRELEDWELEFEEIRKRLGLPGKGGRGGIRLARLTRQLPAPMSKHGGG